MSKKTTQLARSVFEVSTSACSPAAIILFAYALLLAGCSGGGGSDGSTTTTPPPPAPPTQTAPTQAEIEKNLGAVLQTPVFQCGTNSDSVTADAAPGSVAVFESDPVRPIALSADGQRLYVTNAPANCLEIYAIENDTLRLASSVSVGLEPVAVAERNANEVWVVNHLSDSVSVVRLDGVPRVLRSLAVGDEPRDIVFAGANRDRAFIAAAFRGQNRPGFSSQSLTAPSTGRADVWVFDAARLDDSPNGNPLTILTLFADTPRALAVSTDGKTVYAAPFMSGNRTTTLERNSVLGQKPAPSRSVDGSAAPATGLIVRYDGTEWRDERGTSWSSRVKFSLPDYDLFAINADAATPTVTKQISTVGTVLFNMAVHPVSGQVFVSNTQAVNHIRFEGPGVTGTSVRGRLHESRISVVNPESGAVDSVHLNSHVDFSLPQGQSMPAGEKAKSLAQPTAMTFSPSGDVLYVAAFGSGKIAAIPAESLSSARFKPDASQHIAVPAGPAGLAISSNGARLYVYSRIDHAVSVINTSTKAVIVTRPMFSPEPVRVKTGRPFLYDANLSSANGTSSCASCHVFGDLDHLAWDLGNPDDIPKANPNSYLPNSPRTTTQFHPMKGPMTTQTLRGMTNHGPMHWRGDRTGTNRQTINGRTETIEEASFKEFNGAFVTLLGRESTLTDEQLQRFTDFVLAITNPPNPVRALDNSLTASQQAGRDIYFNVNNITGLGSCNNCHTLDPANKRFGSNGLMTFEGLRVTDNFKVPQVRNVYTKAGMFGASSSSGASRGPQIRGFGFSNDGSIDTLDTFFSDIVFNFPSPVATTRAQVIDFVMAFDTDHAPVVGQQISWRNGASAAIEARVSLLKAQATAAVPACDLVARVSANDGAASGLLQTDGAWLMRNGDRVSDTDLRKLATASQPITFTCVPVGSGKRIALNRS